VGRKTDRILIGLVAALAVALVWVVYGTLQPPVVNAGDKAPNFTILTDRGHKITPSDFGGKLLVLNFWATWCTTCVVEMPSLNVFQRELGPQGVVVLAVSVDVNERLYKQFLQSYHITFDTWRDPDSEIASRYGTFEFPETYIIDSSGRVVEKIISNQDWTDQAFLAHIRKMLAAS
jgi:cytochrome c biogenesis protein CcmG, thiol:disulfide interchange protein DsbE